MSEQVDEPFFSPGDEPQIPLGVKYDDKLLWRYLKDTFRVDATGAAIIVAAVEAHRLGKAVSYSRSKPFYESDRQRHALLTYRRVIAAVDQLEADGMIVHYRQAPGCRGWQSAFEATPDLVDAVTAILEGKPLKLQRLHRLTILRDADGRPMDYKPTREIDRRDRKTEGFNEAIGSAKVVSLEGANLACPMARIHNRDFDRGGRFYPMGTSWQNIKSEARKALTIGGEAVVELDFKTLHPAILYAEAGVPMPADCYAIDGWPRDLVKVAMLTLINARTVHAARLSIANNDRMAQRAKPGSQEAIGYASALIEAIKRAHAPIAHAFHSDAGARLMRIDSDLAEAVMHDLILRKGVVTLPVHDSFLVPVSKRDELEAAMLDAAHKIGLHSIAVTEAK